MPIRFKFSTGWLCGILFLVFAGRPQPASAVPACPDADTLLQPDGTPVRLFLRGDEHLHWNEDAAGYTVLKEATGGRWVYAVTNAAGELVGSSRAVGQADPAALGVPKRLLPAGAVAAASSASAARRAALLATGLPVRKAPLTGTMKNLVLLVAFSDKAFTYTTNQFDALFNTIGYTTDGAQGSVKDYYKEVSYNQLTVDSVVVAPVTLANGYAYYGGNDSSGNDLRPREMVQQALAALEARGFDFSTLDNDSDGWVDGLTVIHAGGGEEYSGNDTNYIWSHQWDLSSAVTYDGKKLQTYHTEPERRGWDSSSSTWGVTRIGVICHENGHFLGLPDFYDYDYDSAGVGDFCLMAGGSWNGDNGTQPAHMSAYCKASLAWVNATTVTAAGTYTVPRVEDNRSLFRLSGNFPSTQYFLVENRQGQGFDASLPGTSRGLLIWHVDETQPDNDDQTHYMLDLEEASGTQHLEANSNSGDDSDYFRSGTMTTFKSNTTPNNLSYAGAALGMDITAVSATASSMTFTVSMNTPVTITGNPQSRTNDPGTAASFTVTATGTAPLYYQWQKNATNISLATNSTYTIGAVTTNDAASYRCRVSNVVNAATSSVAVLTVNSAPVFNPLSVQTAVVAVAKTVTVSAAGTPAPVLALQSATASSGYSFTAGTGVLVYTPPGADGGSTRTFTFTASNSLGVATQAVSVVVNEAPPAAPAAIWAGATNATDFTAAWSAAAGATGYRLDVATNSSFSGGGGSGSNLIAEGFASATPSGWTLSGVGSYSTSPYVGTNLAGTYSLKFDTTGDYALTPAFATGATNLQFWAYGNGGSGSIFTVSGLVNSVWTRVNTNIIAQNGATYAVALNPQTTQLGFFFTKSVNCALDDVIVQAGAGGASAYVPGYSNRTVAGTSESVTGLTANSTYYFRVRAENAGGTSGNSATGNVTTLAGLAAPVFGANPGPAATTAGVAVVFTVSATGTPAPGLALQGATASAGYSFTPATGQLSYTPPQADAGARTFTFTASNAAGVATQTVSVAVTAATLPVFTSGSTYATTTGVQVAFTVAAAGPPAPGLALQGATVSSGYSFTPASGAFSYTPVLADIGAQVFTFTASNAAGVRTQAVTVTVSDLPASVPVFGPNPGPVSATTGVLTAFTVTVAGGYPAPVLALQGATATADSYLFEAGTGYFIYEPPAIDAGAQAFTFTASNIAGVATQIVNVAVAAGIPAAPVSVWAGATNAAGFTATWSPSLNATGYRLDVGTNSAFTGGSAGAQSVLASNAATSATAPADWLYNISASSSSYLILGYATNFVVSEAFSTAGFTNLTVDFSARTYNGTAAGTTNITVSISGDDGASWTAIGVVAPAVNSMVAMPTLTNTAALGGGQTRIRWEAPGASSNKGVGIQTLVIKGWSGGSLPAFVAGYSNRTVTGTSESVTGLAANATYYFRVRAANASGISGNSATAQVTTASGIADQTISAFLPASGAGFVATDAVGLSAAASSGLAVTFAVASGPGTITGATNLVFTGAGSVAVVASQAGNGSWNPAPDVTNTYEVAKAAAGVILENLSQTYDGAPKVVSAATVPPGLAVDLTYDGAATAPTNVGSYAVTGTVNDARYQGVAADMLVVAKAVATVTLEGLAQTYDGSPKVVTAATVPAGLAVDFTYGGLPTAPAAAGSYAVTGTVNDLNYAGSANSTLSVAKAGQTITFPAIAGQVATSTVALAATASGGLPVEFSVASGPAVISGGSNLAFTGAGAVSIAAAQPGDANWNPAPNVTNTFAVAKAAAAVTLENLVQAYDGTPKSVTAATVPPGLAVDITYDGSPAAPSAAGSYAVTATVNDAIYAGSAAGTLAITNPPTPFEQWLLDRTLDPEDPRYDPAADDDHDGATTEEEYLADTDPALAGSVFVITGAYDIATVPGGTGQIRMAFPASTARYYQLEYCIDLTNHIIGTRNLGWGVPGMVVTDNAPGTWYGVIRSRLQEPGP